MRRFKKRSIAEQMKDAIEEETGRRPIEVDVHPDPYVKTTYAVRAKFADGTRDFQDGEWSEWLVMEDGAEGVEYHEWPPRAGNLKFF